MSTTQEEVIFSNISATTAAFNLKGGQYGITVSATFGGGTVTLQKLSADESTYVTAATAFSAAGFSQVYLPPGTYKVAVATATAVYVEIKSILQSWT